MATNKDILQRLDCIESNMASQPEDRKNNDSHEPDYIIIQKNMNMNTNIEILKNKNDPKIPANIELIYVSNSEKTLVYKINN